MYTYRSKGFVVNNYFDRKGVTHKNHGTVSNQLLHTHLNKDPREKTT